MSEIRYISEPKCEKERQRKNWQISADIGRAEETVDGDVNVDINYTWCSWNVP